MKTKKLNLEELQKIGGGFDGFVRRGPRNPKYYEDGNVNNDNPIAIIINFLRRERRIWWR